jgi:hypothetical protein
MLHPEATDASYDKLAGSANTFDAYYDRYQAGEYGEPGAEAWAIMMEKFSGSTKVELVAGATALTSRYEELAAGVAGEVEAFDAIVAEHREARLLSEHQANIAKL